MASDDHEKVEAALADAAHAGGLSTAYYRSASAALKRLVAERDDAQSESGRLLDHNRRLERDLAITRSYALGHDELSELRRACEVITKRAERAERAERDLAEARTILSKAVGHEDEPHETLADCARLLVLDCDAEHERATAAERERDEALSAAHKAIDVDHSGLARALNSIRAEVRGRSWIIESRGPYEWDDERYRDEAGHAFAAVLTIIETALTESGQRVADHKRAVAAMMSARQAKGGE